VSSGDLELSLESLFWSLEGEKVTFLLSEMAWEPGGRSGLSAVLSIFDVRGRMRGAAEFFCVGLAPLDRSNRWLWGPRVDRFRFLLGILKMTLFSVFQLDRKWLGSLEVEVACLRCCQF